MFSHIQNGDNNGYQSLIESIRQKVQSSELSPGQKLPTLAVVSKQTGLANYSVRKAISALVEEGILETEQGGGVYVSHKLAEVRIAVADAFRFDDSYPQLRHPITISGIYSQASEKGITVDLLRPDTNFSNISAVKNQIKAGNYSGIIWLYPEEDRMDCIEAVHKEIPIVLTSHSRTDFDIPAVESDESWNAVKVARHFLKCNVHKVVQLVEPWVIQAGSRYGIDHSGGHISSINSLKTTFSEAGFDNYHLVGVSNSEIKYRDTFFETIETLENGCGVYLANIDCFRAVIETDFDKLIEHFSRLNVVIATTEVDNNSLAPLAEHIDLFTSVNPLAKIGSISLQKLINVINGLNEDTATIVRIDFGRFCRLNVNETQAQACAV